MKHNVNIWFKDIDLENYFFNEFTKNTMGQFKAPYSTNKNFNSDNSKIIYRLTEIAILQITQAGVVKHRFDNLLWVWLMEDTKHSLRQAAMEQVQFMVNNRQIWEKINTSSFQTPNGFQITNEMTNWLIKSDMVGTITKSLIDESGIKNYELQTNSEFILNDEGQIYVVGKVDLDKLKELDYA